MIRRLGPQKYKQNALCSAVLENQMVLHVPPLLKNFRKNTRHKEKRSFSYAGEVTNFA
jgi:hypothetical protein